MFEKTFHYCAVGLAHVGIDGTFIRVNKKLCDFLDYSDQELTKLTFQDLTAPDHLDEDLDQFERLLEGQIDNYSIEKRYIRRDGKRVWAKLTVSLVRDDSNNPDYFISVVEDIDEKRSKTVYFAFIDRCCRRLSTTLLRSSISCFSTA